MGRSTGKEGIPGKGLAWGRGRGYRVGIEGGGDSTYVLLL